jgi:SAM-dependent methyltransferase
MPFLSDLARRKKLSFFIDPIPKDAAILEIGSGDGWVGKHLKANGWTRYQGIDVQPPADLVGDIRDYASLGLRPGSFDVIVAFEVVEHVDCFRECYELLKPGGRLLATSPVPEMDWVMKMLEAFGLNQKRTSPHDHLIHFEKVPFFEKRELRKVGGLAQWGIFTKAPTKTSAG